MTKTAEEIRAAQIAKFAAEDAAQASAFRATMAPQIAAYAASDERKTRASEILNAVKDSVLNANADAMMRAITAILEGKPVDRSLSLRLKI
jgi:hypothetical protein